MKKIIIGITLLIIIVLFIVLIVLINSGIELSRLNSMYKDVDVLEEKIALYYINNGHIPVNERIKFESSINPNDNEIFYEIDLRELDSLYLNYGQKIRNENDFYIINDESHTIYYYDGIKYKGKIYYTKDINYTLVEQN